MSPSPEAPPLARVAAASHRLIPSRYPPVGVFDAVAAPEDLAAVFELEGWTNDRLNAELGRLYRVPRDQWVTGVTGASLIMAAFCHPNPLGGRFSNGDLGAWYAGLALDTAIAETVYHHTQRLLDTGLLQVRIQMRQLIATIDSDLHDIRGWREEAPGLPSGLYNPRHYDRSQPFGVALRNQGSQGIVYDSVRHKGGTCIAIFIPSVIPAALQGDHYEYRWTGKPEPAVRRLPTP